ncbi:hypothetical protein F5877DRAFT_44746, partial [Lentinula edodes]
YNLTGRFDTLPPAGKGVPISWAVMRILPRLGVVNTSTMAVSKQFSPSSC